MGAAGYNDDAAEPHRQVTRHYIGYHGARPDIPGGASLDEGLLSLSLSNLLYVENT